MENYEYKSNSHKSKEQNVPAVQDKKVEKVVTGSVQAKKQSGLQKVSNLFIPEDVDDVKSYVFEDIVVPAVKDIVLDTVKAFLGVNGRSGDRKTPAARVSYGSYYNGNRSRDREAARNRISYDFDDIILDNRGDAERVLVTMDELIDTYGLVSVGDFYDLVGVSGNYTDNKYGWTDLRTARVEHVRGGYLIKLPKASPLD